MNIISFPGLGIDGFKVNKIAFNLFGREVAWYGIILTLGIIAGFFYTLRRAKKDGIKEDDIYDLAFFTVITAIIGARLYYVLCELENYHTFYDVIAIWEGGLAIYGAIIAGAVSVILVCRHKKLNTLAVLDAVSPAVMLGQLIGRWGNFTNAEAHGGVTDIFIRMGIQANGVGETIYYHPTFLYESLWNLVGFILINIFYNKRKFKGQIFLEYMAWYGFGRMLIEGLRTDSLYIPGTEIRTSQLIGFLSFAVCSVVIAVILRKIKNKEKAGGNAE